MPTVIGAILDDVMTGSLACWKHVTALAPDGHDVENNSTQDDVGAIYRITEALPSPGTPIGRTQEVHLHLVEVDPSVEPAAFHPCDWVTIAEAANFLHDPTAHANPTGQQAGSATPTCEYDSGAHVVTSELELPQSFPLDAQTEFDMTADNGSGREVTGLAGRAYCTSTSTADGQWTALMVLLGGHRLYQAASGDGVPCEELTQFAQTAIPRIGP